MDECQRLHDVGEHGREDGHVEQRSPDHHATRLGAQAEPEHEEHAQSEKRATDHGDVGRLVAAMGQRERRREIAGAGQRINLPSLGVDDRVEGRDQACDRDQSNGRGGGAAVQRAQRVQQGLSRAAECERSDAGHGRVQPEHQKCRQQEREHRGDDAPWHVASRVVTFLGGKRDLLDREEQPDREGQRREDAADTVREKRAAALRQVDAARTDIQCIAFEVGTRKGADPEHPQAREGEKRDGDGDAERELDAEHVQAHEHDVARDPPQWLQGGVRAEDAGQIASDEEHDHAGDEDVFDVLREAGEEATPWAEGGAGEGVGATGVGQCRCHLCDGEGQSEVHDRDDAGGDEHAAPPRDRKSEVPAREVARDDRADRERPERDDAGVAPQTASLEVGCVGFPVGDRPACASRPVHGSERLAEALEAGREPGFVVEGEQYTVAATDDLLARYEAEHA